MPAGVVFALGPDRFQQFDSAGVFTQIIVGPCKPYSQFIAPFGGRYRGNVVDDPGEILVDMVLVQPADQRLAGLFRFVLAFFPVQAGDAARRGGTGIIGGRDVMAEHAFAVGAVFDGGFQRQEFTVAGYEFQSDGNGTAGVVFPAGVVLHAGELEPAPGPGRFDLRAAFDGG